MRFGFNEYFCCTLLHGFYSLFLAFFYLLSYLKSITPSFCVIVFFCFFLFFVILRIRSSQQEVFRKRVLWDSDIVLGETLWRALLIFFPSFFIIIIIVFFENLAKISDNPFLITCDLEDAYFVSKLLMVASDIISYSEIYNPI